MKSPAEAGLFFPAASVYSLGFDVAATGSAGGLACEAAAGASTAGATAAGALGVSVGALMTGDAGSLADRRVGAARATVAGALAARARAGAGVSRRATFTGAAAVSARSVVAGAPALPSPADAAATAVRWAGTALAAALPGSDVAWLRNTAPPITDAVMMPSGIENWLM